MNTNQIISLAILIGGVVLLIFGLSAMDSFGSDVSRVFTGTPTDKSMWMFISGLVLAIVGLGGIGFLRDKNSPGQNRT
ncbi:MAG: DUF3185 family protein [Opitutales bacterium]|nr:DUF3185 family protein [Opitutales bacterium]MCH8539766.1 DUF3185 family protein [Opitutales bacterium]